MFVVLALLPLQHPEFAGLTVTTQSSRYTDFLRLEFEKNGFLRSDQFELKESLLGEVGNAVFTQQFEGKQATYGSLLLGRRLNSYRDRLPPFHEISDRDPKAQRLADGVYVFHTTAADFVGLLTFKTAIVDELDAFALRDDTLFKDGTTPDSPEPFDDELYLVKRYEDGRVLALCREGTASLAAGRWDFRPYQYDYMRCLGVPGLSENQWDLQIPRAILRMCVHLLGPIAGAGATFVLLASSDEEACRPHNANETIINRTAAFQLPWSPRVDERHNQRPLVHLLTQTDGAVLVRPDGQIDGIRCWLVPSTDSTSALKSDGGTRHLTAMAFSSQIDGLVFVVSSDGPVTVYRAGEVVVSTKHLQPALI